ncbi:unnamed protein product [Anisakis simplex]|uniref:Enhancer of polycomb-like protein n=1 Tax=Anisakis simplex TaxID=6269 RepID=A0A3P6S6L7_ANISI|nr:unnamed protein product [Anisakis simplex]
MTIDREQAEYDIDSEDERWISERGHLSGDEFERMMELLEGASSDMQICQPKEARSLLKDFDEDLIDDVYDYWLQKRKDAAAKRNIASLIPRVKTDNRRDTPGSLNPYVAFRRRAEKIQTRRNRKNDEDSYEKMMREKGKLEMVKLDEMILDARWRLGDSGSHYYNQLLSKLKPDPLAVISSDQSQDEIANNTTVSVKSKVNGHKKKKHARNAAFNSPEKDALNRMWLKKVAEVGVNEFVVFKLLEAMWNRPQMSTTALSGACSQRASSLADAERNAVQAEAVADGRYAFKRRRGCVYRDVLPSSVATGDINIAEELEARLRGHAPSLLRSSAINHSATSNTQPSALTCKDASLRFYKTYLPSLSTKGARRCIGYARRRVGRGGRIIFDRFQCSPPSTSQRAPDDLPHPYIDLTRGYFDCSFLYLRTYEGRLADVESDCSDCWSVDSDEERLQAERDEEYYLRRDELFRMRIFEGASSSSQPFTQHSLQTVNFICLWLFYGSAPEAYEEYIASMNSSTNERYWPDTGGSNATNPSLSIPPAGASVPISISHQRSVLGERGANSSNNFRTSPLKDNNINTTAAAVTSRYYHACSAVVTSSSRENGAMNEASNNLISNNNSTSIANSSKDGSRGDLMSSNRTSKPNDAFVQQPSNMLLNGAVANGGGSLMAVNASSNGILVMPSSSSPSSHQDKRITSASAASNASSSLRIGTTISASHTSIMAASQSTDHNTPKNTEELPIFYRHLPPSETNPSPLQVGVEEAGGYQQPVSPPQATIVLPQPQQQSPQAPISVPLSQIPLQISDPHQSVRSALCNNSSTATLTAISPVRVPFRQTATKRLNTSNNRSSIYRTLTDSHKATSTTINSNGTAVTENQRIRVNGVKRARGSSPATIAQLATSIVTEANLKRLSVGKLNGNSDNSNNGVSSVGCVDTKRLELAIAGSGARIKVPPLNSSISPLNGIKEGSDAPLKSPKTITYSSAATTNNRHYHDATITSAATLSPTSLPASNCYLQSSDNLVAITSSPDSESMSPPLSTSPAVVPEIRRHFARLSDTTKLQTPVAVISGSMNGGISSNLLNDKTHNVGDMTKKPNAVSRNCISRTENMCAGKRLPITAAPCAEVAAVPRCGVSNAVIESSADAYHRQHPTYTTRNSQSSVSSHAQPAKAVPSPQPMGPASPNTVTSPACIISSPTSSPPHTGTAFYISSKLAHNNNTAPHIGLSEGSLAG